MGLAVYNEEPIRAFLGSGYKDRNLVIRFFVWDHTPQGHYYWHGIYSGRPISQEGIEYLRGLVGMTNTYPEDGSWV